MGADGHGWTREDTISTGDVRDRTLFLREGSRVAIWISSPTNSGMRVQWRNLAYKSTTDEISEVDISEQITEPAVERPKYVIPTTILPWPVGVIQTVKIAEDEGVSPLSRNCTSDQGKIDRVNSNNPHSKIEANIGDSMMDDEATATTEEVKIDDLQIGDAKINTQEEIERLVHIIWKRKHLLIVKGNAVPPAAKGAVRDIDAKPVAQRCRKVAVQFREKLIS
ncbi:Hypothetical protein PHPALM_9239 [Phytophthora palmivora]|uniref:Reverse transcriptase n=1 Tax=Phytophthora palmivora TaxID=4796 RepID=A0A2P4Y864_9STRA|nr:Hypothetical protein PHPALM_9239 [Phytophthora palmivora]